MTTDWSQYEVLETPVEKKGKKQAPEAPEAPEAEAPPEEEAWYTQFQVEEEEPAKPKKGFIKGSIGVTKAMTRGLLKGGVGSLLKAGGAQVVDKKGIPTKGDAYERAGKEIQRLMGSAETGPERVLERTGESIGSLAVLAPSQAALVSSGLAGAISGIGKESGMSDTAAAILEGAVLLAGPGFAKTLAKTGKTGKTATMLRELGVPDRDIALLSKNKWWKRFMTGLSSKGPKAEKVYKRLEESKTKVLGALEQESKQLGKAPRAERQALSTNLREQARTIREGGYLDAEKRHAMKYLKEAADRIGGKVVRKKVPLPGPPVTDIEKKLLKSLKPGTKFSKDFVKEWKKAKPDFVPYRLITKREFPTGAKGPGEETWKAYREFNKPVRGKAASIPGDYPEKSLANPYLTKANKSLQNFYDKNYPDFGRRFKNANEYFKLNLEAKHLMTPAKMRAFKDGGKWGHALFAIAFGHWGVLQGILGISAARSIAAAVVDRPRFANVMRKIVESAAKNPKKYASLSRHLKSDVLSEKEQAKLDEKPESGKK